MTEQTRTVEYAVQRGWSQEWGWHWLIIDQATRENVGLLIEAQKTLEIQQPIICNECGRTSVIVQGFCLHCGHEQ